MFSSLLISRKNGRTLKTYGVKSVKGSNMKFSFICVVIGFSCCAAIRGDLGIYPGLNFELNQVEGSPLDNIDESNYYGDPYKQEWPWQKEVQTADDLENNEGKETKLDYALKRKLRQIFEIARAQMSDRNYPARNTRRFEEDPLKNFKTFPSRDDILGQYGYDLPATQQILEDVRMYPPEDDFSFNEENAENKLYQDITADDQDVLLRSHIPKTSTFKNQQLDYDSGMHHTHEDEEYRFKENEEFPSVSFKNIPVVEDPTEFGYGPSDARFHKHLKNNVQNDRNSQVPQQRQAKETHVADSISYRPNPETFSKFRVSTRNDQKISKLLDNTDDGFDDELLITRDETPERNGLDVVAVRPPHLKDSDSAGVYIIAVVAGISAAATVGLIAVGIGWYNLQRHMKNAEETDYPSYGIVGPNKDYEKRDRDETAGDRRLAQSAQMYHYQHQKQQIIAMGRHPQGGHGSVSDTDEEEDEEGNYTVYECPGLASIEGPLEVRNPMFDDEQLATPSQTPSKPTTTEETK